MVARSSVLLAVLLLTVLGGVVRFNGLAWHDGDLSTDEARMALAARGVLETGLPILPSGRLYTRGLVTVYATAPSIAAFGVHDWAARLPSVIAGALLVSAVFLLAQVAVGSGPALAAGLIVLVAGPLVKWSLEAWPPAMFLLLFTLTAYAGFRGFVRNEARWQIVAAVGFLLTMLAYELAMILPAGLGLYLATRGLRGDVSWWQGRSTLAALGIAALAVALLAVLGLALRSGTLAGADAEFRHYFTPSLHLSGVGFYWRQVWRTVLPLAMLAPAGLLWCQLRGRPAPRGFGYVFSLILVAALVPTWVIQDKQEVQYGLAVLPLAAALAAWGIGALAGLGVAPEHERAPDSEPTRAPILGDAQTGEAGVPQDVRRGGRQEARIPVSAIFAAIFLAVMLWRDASNALHPFVLTRTTTWLDSLQRLGFRADDPNIVVLAEAPLVAELYLGRADFYVQPDGFERYAYQDGSLQRSLYTRALLLKERGDFERLVAGPYAGKTLWVIGQSERLSRLMRQMDPDLWDRLRDQSRVAPSPGGYIFMRVTLPPR